jgi:hypothetical protein
MPSLRTWIDYGTQSGYGCELASSYPVEVFIKRSQGRPLDIRLSSHSYAADLGATDANADEFSYQDAERALDIIFDHAWRWQSAHLNLLSANVELGLGSIFGDGIHPCRLPYGILAQVAKSLSLVTLSVPAVVYSYTPPVCIATLQTLKISGPLLGEVPGDPSNWLLFFLSAPALNRLIFSNFSPDKFGRLRTYLECSQIVETYPLLHALEIIPKNGSAQFDFIDESLMRALPTIKDLIVVEPSIFNTLRLLSTTALWSSLPTVQFGKNITQQLLVDVLDHRALIGCPITKLFLPSVSPNTNCSIDHERLKKSVDVEVFDWCTYCSDSRDRRSVCSHY